MYNKLITQNRAFLSAKGGSAQEGRTKMKTMKKIWFLMATMAATLLLCVISASACTMVYVGSDLTSDGSSFLARSEDFSNSYNKIAYVNQHGKYKAGSVYEGCYGFTHTFTHDSYSYTATSDDITSGVCPDCGQTHPHTPMEEVGTNEKGVSVSAMVTLRANSKVTGVDPMVGGGMCESDMATILLSEATTAKEGVELLLDIYNTVGAEEKSGVLIADQNEIWYVENFTGHTYTAIKLSSHMITINPNMGAIGLVDLDDTENVIASANLISVAEQAGTFVGDKNENTIDVFKSYCYYASGTPSGRLVNGINYFLNGGYPDAGGLHHFQCKGREDHRSVHQHSEQAGPDRRSKYGGFLQGKRHWQHKQPGVAHLPDPIRCAYGDRHHRMAGHGKRAVHRGYSLLPSSDHGYV